jgi:hypothetical protein
MNDSTLYQCFVDPEICRQLMDAGLGVNMPFCWIVKNGKAHLFSLAFDEDNYYSQAFANVGHVNPFVIIPASKINIEYELNCSSLFEFDVEKASRMPDVYAKMVLKGIVQGKIDPVQAIIKITAKI